MIEGRNILVVNVNWVGDVIFSTPVFKAIKKKFPQARTVCLAVPRVKEVLECCPHIDEIIEYDERGRHYSPLAKVKLVGELRRQRFDAALLLHGSWTRSLLAYAAGIPVRAGYETKKRGRRLTHSAGVLPEEMHRSDVYLKVAETLGIPVEDRAVELAVDPSSAREVEDLLARHGISSNDRVVVINTGGNWDLKRWPESSFTALIGRLMQEGTKVVIPGAAKDATRVEAITAPLAGKPVVLTGATSLKQLLALMQRAALVVSSDSGPLHLASSVGTPVIGLFGPTRPDITGPRGRGPAECLSHDVGCNKAPCYYLDCPDNFCMKAVTPDEVTAAVRRTLAR